MIASLARARRLALCSLVLLAAACAPALGPLDRDPRLLNSERIERRFGSYGIEVLEAAGPVRVANLYSLEGERRVCRTFAVALLPEDVDPRLAAEHARVVAGGSIGAVFEAAGWTIAKRHEVVTELASPPAGQRLASLMHLGRPRPLAVAVYRFTVARDGVALEYATIAEVYHPGYLRLADLRAMLGDVPATAAPGSPAAELLGLVERAAQRPLLARLSQTPAAAAL